MTTYSYLFVGTVIIAASLASSPKAYASEQQGKHRLAQEDGASQDKVEKRKKKKKRKKVSEDTDTNADASAANDGNDEEPVRSHSSLYNRGDKPVSLQLELAAVNLINFGGGGELDYAVTTHEVIGLSALQAGSSVLGVKQNIAIYTVNSRTFVGNSFYILVGAGVRRSSYIEEYYTITSSGQTTAESSGIGTLFGIKPDETNEFTMTQAILELGVGNRWQFGSGFSLGCDWMAIDVPVARLSSSEKYGPHLTQEQKNDSYASFKKAGTETTVTYTRLSLGWAF